VLASYGIKFRYGRGAERLNKKLIASAVLMAISGQMQAFAAGPVITGSNTRKTDTRIDTREKSKSTVTSSTHHVRTHSEAKQHRSAHSKNRLDHTINKTMMIMRSPVTSVNVSRMPKIDTGSKSSSDKQHFVITAGHDDKDGESSDKEKAPGGQTVASRSGELGSRADDKSGSRADDKSGSRDNGKIAQGEKSSREDRKTERQNKRDERRAERGARRAERRGSFFSHFHHSKKNDVADSGNSGGPGSGNQGIGDGSNVSMNNAPTINELNNNPSIKTITLKQGDAFVAHNKTVHINTSRGQIRIAPHSAVYVVAEGKSVAVYNIADKKTSDVLLITSGKKALPVKAGEQVVLADKENKEFEKANPVPEIHAQRTKELGEDMENRIFNAEFSPLAALDHAAGFHDLVNSKNKEDRKLADQILKMAAIVLSLRASDQ
jgi:hypothetical protein